MMTYMYIVNRLRRAGKRVHSISTIYEPVVGFTIRYVYAIILYNTNAARTKK